MNRPIEHAAVVRRTFDDVREIIDRHAPLVMSAGTEAAGARTALMLDDTAEPTGAFDPREPLVVVIDDVGTARTDHLWIECRWTANREKRLLANVSARLDFHPVMDGGRRRSTEIRLRAEYDPAPGWRRSPEAMLFGRRVVRAALLRFVEQIVQFLEDHEETIDLRIEPSPSVWSEV